MGPLISVIIPVYNVASYLRKCVDRVIHQTYGNLEILLVDDGSTDECPSICDDYARKDTRIKVTHKKNGGLSDARNKGLDMAKGELVTFIDSDDFIELDMIEYLYNLLDVHHADMSVCQRNEVEEATGQVKKRLQISDQIIDGNRQCMMAFFTNSAIDTVAWGKLYRTSFFKHVRYPFGRHHEDVFTTYKLIAQCDRIVVGRAHKYNYLLRKGSLSKSTFQYRHLDGIEANKVRSAFIRERYPECLTYANAGIIYATNSCVIEIIQSKVYLPDLIAKMQKDYRLYEFDFLRGKSSLKAKLFSIFAWMNLKLLIKVMEA